MKELFKEDNAFMISSEYFTAMEKCIKSKLDVRIWNFIVNNINSDYSVKIDERNVAKEASAVSSAVLGLVRKMIKQNVVKPIKDYYEFNPFIYRPITASDEYVLLKQDEWERYPDGIFLEHNGWRSSAMKEFWNND